MMQSQLRCAEEEGCCCLQEQTFLRDLAMFANNIGAANNSLHSNLTSWTW